MAPVDVAGVDIELELFELDVSWPVDGEFFEYVEGGVEAGCCE